MKKYLFFAVVLLGCVSRTLPPPKSVEQTSGPKPFEEIAKRSESPARSASMRIVSLGKTELDQLKYERAATNFTKALEIDSTNPFPYFYLALTRMTTGRLVEASQLFSRAGDLFTSDPAWRSEAWAYQGECLEKSASKDAARLRYEKALQVDASNERARRGLERVGVNNG